MGAEVITERRAHSRFEPIPARAVAAGDSLLLASSWKHWSDAQAIARWDALALRAGEPNPFLESWHLLPALRRFDPAGRAEILRFERGGELLGLVPIERAWRYQRWPLPHLRGWRQANSFNGAPLVARGHEHAFWSAFLAWADANCGAALFAHLAQLPLGGPLADALFALAERQGRRVALVHREERALLRSEPSRADSVRDQQGEELRHQRAQLAEQGRLSAERFTDERCLATWIDHFLALEASVLNEGFALASTPAMASLFREALLGAAARGRLERTSLMLNGRPIAMLASFFAPPGAFSFKTAIDGRFAQFSPGALLQLENLALLEHDAVDWCDIGTALDHPLIDALCPARRAAGKVSIAIGGAGRRAAFDRLVEAPRSHPPSGLAD